MDFVLIKKQHCNRIILLITKNNLSENVKHFSYLEFYFQIPEI